MFLPIYFDSQRGVPGLVYKVQVWQLVGWRAPAPSHITSSPRLATNWPAPRRQADWLLRHPTSTLIGGRTHQKRAFSACL